MNIKTLMRMSSYFLSTLPKKGRHYLFFAGAALLFYGYKKKQNPKWNSAN